MDLPYDKETLEQTFQKVKEHIDGVNFNKIGGVEIKEPKDIIVDIQKYKVIRENKLELDKISKMFTKHVVNTSYSNSTTNNTHNSIDVEQAR